MHTYIIMVWKEELHWLAFKYSFPLLPKGKTNRKNKLDLIISCCRSWYKSTTCNISHETITSSLRSFLCFLSSSFILVNSVISLLSPFLFLLLITYLGSSKILVSKLWFPSLFKLLLNITFIIVYTAQSFVFYALIFFFSSSHIFSYSVKYY